MQRQMNELPPVVRPGTVGVGVPPAQSLGTPSCVRSPEGQRSSLCWPGPCHSKREPETHPWSSSSISPSKPQSELFPEPPGQVSTLRLSMLRNFLPADPSCPSQKLFSCTLFPFLLLPEGLQHAPGGPCGSSIPIHCGDSHSSPASATHTTVTLSLPSSPAFL